MICIVTKTLFYLNNCFKQIVIVQLLRYIIDLLNYSVSDFLPIFVCECNLKLKYVCLIFIVSANILNYQLWKNSYHLGKTKIKAKKALCHKKHV